ncbi:hypothetical protein MSG28_010680 [Choristoneura fumiferana]|uniref:Uncharacterized protein n=1 Tax=Choristoneura fumiferana TaxID=7141 RepID=A0ACC0KP54_CHOFU|nr:hypothetical protein MSG28_010680 [Choristoneura fumiferana]
MPRKLLKFLIVFDNTSLLYFPGQFLSGKVLMELQDDTPVLGNGASVLSPGIHSFPFKLGLPMGLPSTFLGTHGWVQYYCKAALREPNGLTHKNQQVFIVMNPIDLNLEPPVLSQEFECSVEHRLGVGCVGGGAVACRVALDRGAYVPGETVALSARLVNHSRTTIRATRAALTEEVRELATLTHGKTRAGGTDTWHNELLYIPPLPPTNLRGCHLIAVQYDVFFIIEPKSLEKEVKLQLPILLGTYPFSSERESAPPAIYPSTLPIFRPWLAEKH